MRKEETDTCLPDCSIHKTPTTPGLSNRLKSWSVELWAHVLWVWTTWQNPTKDEDPLTPSELEKLSEIMSETKIEAKKRRARRDLWKRLGSSGEQPVVKEKASEES